MQWLRVFSIFLFLLVPLTSFSLEEQNEKKFFPPFELYKQGYFYSRNYEHVFSDKNGPIKIDDTIKDALSKGILKPFDISFFESCKPKCVEEFERIHLTKLDDEYFNKVGPTGLVTFYEDPELKKPLGEAVAGLYRFTVKIDGVVHTLDWQNLYEPFLKLTGRLYIYLGGNQYIDQKTKELKIRGPEINGPSFLGTTQLNDGSYYVPWIKKFVYFPKDNGFFDGPIEASKYYNVSQENKVFPKIPNDSECKFTGRTDFLTFTKGSVPLKTLDGKAIDIKDLKKHRITTIEYLEDHFKIYILDMNGPIKGNLIGNEKIDPGELLTYYKMDKITPYILYHKDLVRDDGSLVLFRFVTDLFAEDIPSFYFVCPKPVSPETLKRIEELRKNGKTNDYDQGFVTRNIYYHCAEGGSRACDGTWHQGEIKPE